MNADLIKLHKNAVDETHELAVYLSGYAAGKGDEKLKTAAEWLEKLSQRGVCGQGYIGCRGGYTCSSDHK